MSISSGLALRALAPLTFLLAQTAVLPAQTVEQPPSFNAAQIPGIKRVDDNYTIRNPVKSDGILRIYVLATPYGDITVQGDEMLRMRINELKALAALEKVSNSESFGKALAEAGLSPHQIRRRPDHESGRHRAEHHGRRRQFLRPHEFRHGQFRQDAGRRHVQPARRHRPAAPARRRPMASIPIPIWPRLPRNCKCCRRRRRPAAWW